MNILFSRYLRIFLTLFVALSAVHFISAQSTWNQLGSDIDGSMGDGQGQSVSISSDGHTMATGAAAGPNSTNKGIVRIYTWNGSSWSQKGTDINGEADGDSFGSSISLSDDGSIVAIGAFSKDLTGSFAPNGRVQVYKWSGSAWIQWGTNLDGVADFENFGESVALSGDGKRLAVGIPGKVTGGGSTGAVRIYRYDTGLSDTDWTQIGSQIDGNEDFTVFGEAVSLDQTGQTVAIGNSMYNGGSSFEGQVQVYSWDSGSSDWVAKGSALGGSEDDAFGSSVSLSDDGGRLVVGAPDSFFGLGPTYYGFVRVFDYSTDWVQVGSDIISDLDSDSFGKEVAISGDGSTIISGATNYLDPDNPNGRAQIWKLNTGTWEQVGVTLTGEASEDALGSAVAISSDGSIVALGAPYNDGGGADAGQVRGYEYGVLAVNTAPVITASQSFDVDENAANSTSVGTVVATDVDPGTTLSSWTITAGNDAGVFAMDATTGEITIANNTTLDFETITSYTLTLTVSDGTDTSDPETVTITVNNLNDNTPSISAAQSFDIDENAANSTSVGTVAATDADAGTTFSSWSITAGNEAGIFALDASSGEITIADNTLLDFEFVSSFTLTLTVSDGANTSAAETVEVAVNDLNDNAPVIAPSQTFEVDENAVNTTSVGTVSAVDGDAGTTFSNWTITAGNDAGVFAIDASTGEITVANNTTLDFETTPSYSLTLTVSDGTNTSDSETVAIAVNDKTSSTVIISSEASDPTNANPITITITFSEEVSGFVAGGITVGNGSADNLQSSDNTTFTADITPTADGIVTVDIAAAVVQDGAGNDNEASSQFSIEYDATAPVVTVEDIFTNDQTPAVSGTVDDPTATVAVLIEGQTYTADIDGSTWSIADDVLPTLIEGSYTIAVQASDGLNTSAVTTATLAIDLTSPEVTFLNGAYTFPLPYSDPVNLQPFLVNIYFGEKTTGLTLSDINITGDVGTTGLSYVEADDYYILAIPLQNQDIDQEITISIPAGVTADLAGNPNVGNTVIIYYDVTSPSVVSLESTGTATNQSPIPVTVTFSEAIAGLTMADFLVTNGAINDEPTTDDNRVFVLNVIPTIEGNVSIQLVTDNLTDLAGNPFTTTPAALELVYDVTAPSVSISSELSELTNVSPIPVTITFSEEVSAFTASNISVGNGSVGNLQTSDNITFTVDITPTTDGSVTVDIAAAEVQDLASNDNTAATQFAIDYDGTAPAAGIDVESDITGPNGFKAYIGFGEEVVGFDLTDITIGNGTASNLIAGGFFLYQIDIMPDGNGDVTIDVAAGVAQDLAGNDNIAAEQVIVTLDVTPPSVTITPPSSLVTSLDPFAITIDFSETIDAETFTEGDVVVSNGSLTNLQVDASDASLYTATVTPAGEGDITFDIAEGRITDEVGNGNTAATQVIVTVDLPPTVEIQDAPVAINSTEPFTITIAFSEDVTGFDSENDVSVGNGAASNFQTTNASTYTVDITPTGDGEMTINVAGGVAFDAINNPNSASQTVVIAIDVTVPSVQIEAPESVTNLTGAFSITIRFSEDVIGFEVGDVEVDNGTADNFQSTDESTYTADITPDGSGDITIDIAAGVATDLAGNENDAASQVTVTYTYLYSGGSGSETDPFLIGNKQDLLHLSGASGDWAYYFKQIVDVTLTNSDYDDKGFSPVGNDVDAFSGGYDGQNFTIDGLMINRTTSYVGLFGFLSGATVKNIKLENVDIASTANIVGGLAGEIDLGTTVENCTVSGQVSGNTKVGGLIGWSNRDSFVTLCINRASVFGIDDEVGGLIGSNSGNVTRCGNEGSVEGGYRVGGLIGYVTGFDEYEVSECYNIGNVRSNNPTIGVAGGVFGDVNTDDIAFRNNFNHGFISSMRRAGGFAGNFFSITPLTDSYSAGYMIAEFGRGFYAGAIILEIARCYYDADLAPLGDHTGDVKAVSSTQMKTQSTFAGWDFDNVWKMDTEGCGYPILQWMEGGLDCPSHPDILLSAMDQEKLEVFPNPSQGFVTIKSPINASFDEVEVYDAVGKLVMKIESESSMQERTLDLSNLTNGVYLIKVYNQAAISTHRVIIQK